MTTRIASRRAAGISVVSAASLILGSVFATSATAYEEPDQKLEIQSEVSEAPAVQTDRFIVQFSDKAKSNSSERGKAYGKTAKELGVTVEEVKKTATGDHVVATEEVLSEAETAELISTLNAQPNVVSVEPDLIMHPLFTPNDTHYTKQWHLYETRAGLKLPQVWDKTTGVGQVVAVIDTGITTHSDLSANILPGYDMITNASMSRDGGGRDSNPNDEGDWVTAGQCDGENGATESSWHGTHVAGSIAAVTNNAKGVSGAAPGVKIVPIRALGSCGGYTSDISDGVIWAAGGTVSGVPANANPARTINLSLGGTGQCTTTFQNAINFAVSKGASVFVASGNSNEDASTASPANCNNVITVGASGREGNRAPYSNYGSHVDVTAPGGDMSMTVANGIASTLNSGTSTPTTEAYSYAQGTSMATPLAASVGALMVAANPSLTPAQVESKLKSTARALPGVCAEGCGAGLIDASAAVVFPTAVAPEPAPVAPAPTPEPTPEPEPEPTPPPVVVGPSATCPTGNVASAPLKDLRNASIKSAKDVVAVDSSGRLWNYIGNGSSGFVKRVQIGSGWQNSTEVFVADWNNDGIFDLVSQWKDGKMKIYPGKIGGGFSVFTIGSAGWQSMHTTVGKFCNGIPYPQIVSKDTSGNLWLYKNVSGSTLSPRVKIGAGWQSFSKLTMVDFDEDGHQDIVTKNSAHNLVLYRTNGVAGFLSESRPVIGAGWNVIRDITVVEGFAGAGSTGFITTMTNGVLRYYSFDHGKFTGAKNVGSGWQNYRITR